MKNLNPDSSHYYYLFGSSLYCYVQENQNFWQSSCTQLWIYHTWKWGRGSSLVVQQLKDLALPELWHRLQLCHGFVPWLGNFHMLWGLPEKKKGLKFLKNEEEIVVNYKMSLWFVGWFTGEFLEILRFFSPASPMYHVPVVSWIHAYNFFFCTTSTINHLKAFIELSCIFFFK